MKTFFSKILDQPNNQPIFSFIPQIKISSKSTLHLQIDPLDPHTASNIVVNTFISKTNRIILPVKIQWSRSKLKSEQQYTIQKISNKGNLYMCEPSDLGAVIQVKVKSIDPSIYGEAQAMIGPIRIDIMLKRLIDGALYNQSLLSQCIIVERKQKVNVNLRVNRKTLLIEDMQSGQKLVMGYSFSEPKIELSPKDPCKVYLRFEQDTENKIRGWLDILVRLDLSEKQKNMNLDESSLTIKTPHSNVSALSSKNRLFQRSHIHCANKIQLRFLSRNYRDLFLFTLRAFICKEDMKNCLVLERVQTLQGLKNDNDFNKFLEYMSLKTQIVRLGQIAREIQIDRDNKIKDINNMQESISEMTLTYLKIIQEKSQNQHVDLQQSYSMISMKRQQIMGRKNFRELKSENDKLKLHIRELNEQIELQRFFKKDEDNEQISMMFNHTQNPFLRKNNISNIDPNQNNASYELNSPQMNGKLNDHAHKNMLQISKSYLKVLQENKKLKQKNRHKNSSSSKSNEKNHDQSNDIENLLISLHESQEQQRKILQMEKKIQIFQQEICLLKQLNHKLNEDNKQIRDNFPTNANRSIQQSFYSKQSNINMSMSNMSRLNSSYVNLDQSMTSEAELNLLEKKLVELAGLNDKFGVENTRLRKQRDYYRGLYQNVKRKSNYTQVQTTSPSNFRNIQPSRDIIQHQNSRIGFSNSEEINSQLLKYKQQNQHLQNQKNALLKKVNSLARQSNSTQYQRKFQQLIRQNEKLLDENESLQKTIENIKTFHQLQKKQFLQTHLTTSNNISTNQQLMKQKRLNEVLLEQMKQLRKQLQRRSDSSLQSSRVIDLRNQLEYYQGQNKQVLNSNRNQHINQQINAENQVNNNSNNINYENQRLVSTVQQLKKQNQRLKQQISNLDMKISTQTKTIQKLMLQLQRIDHSHELNGYQVKQTTQITKNKTLQNQIQVYQCKIIQLEKQLVMLRRNSDAFNRSHDLSMSMIGYEEQRMDILKKENENLMIENENLSKICSKYAKDAREAHLQINKLRQKIIIMNKQRLCLDD